MADIILPRDLPTATSIGALSAYLIVDNGSTVEKATPQQIVDAAGGKGDPGGNVMAVGLATALPAMTVDVGTDLIQTTGYDEIGLGAALYVSDSLADAALQTAHPECCFETLNGRFFRLLPQEGMILLTQVGALGDPAGLGAVNDQPAFQAAMDYCGAIGCGVVGIDRNHSVWARTRTTPAAGVGWDHQTDGHFTVLPSDQQITFKGLTPASKPWIRMFNVTGDTFNGTTPGTNFQVVSATVFRGAMFYVETDTVDPGEDTRSKIRLEGLRFDGGAGKTSDFTWPADPADGDGGDITHHIVFVEPQAGTGYGGSVEVVDCEIYNCRGGFLYVSNQPIEYLYIDNTHLESSNEDGINPNSCRTYVRNTTVKEVFQGFEGTFGEDGYMVNTVFIDCYGVYGSSGAVGFFQGGKFGSPTHAYPARINATVMPSAHLDITARHCGNMYIGCWLNGAVRLIDTTGVFGDTNAGPGGCFETKLDITVVTDQTNNAKLFINDGQAAAGDMWTDRLDLNVHHIRTDDAVAGGFNPTTVVDYWGSLGPFIRIHLTGVPGTLSPVNSIALDDYAPSFTGDVDYVTSGGAALQNVQTTPAIDRRCPVITLTTTDPGTYTATMPDTKIAKGTECLLVNTTSNASVQFNGNNISSSKVRFSGFVIIPPGGRVRMRFDGTFWYPLDAVSKALGVHVHGGNAVTMGVHEQNAIAEFSHSGGAITYTIPLNSTLPVPIGSFVEWYLSGTSTLGFAATGGVTLNSEGALVAAAGRYARGRLEKVGLDTWVLSGNLA